MRWSLLCWSGRDDPDLRLTELNLRAGPDLAPAPAIDLAVDTYLAALDQASGMRAVIDDPGKLQKLPEPDHLTGDGDIDGVAHLVA